MKKYCKSCQTTKDVSEFNRRRQRGKDGLQAKCRVCEKKYKDEHKEHIKKQNKVYARENKIAITERNRVYRQSNPERERTRHRIYDQGHREQKCEASRRFRRRHPDRIRASGKRYRQSPKGKATRQAYLQRPEVKTKQTGWTLKWRNSPKGQAWLIQWLQTEVALQWKRHSGNVRRARERQNGVDRVDYVAIIRREGMRCHICGKKMTMKTLSFDHIIPVAEHGPTATWNLLVAHIRCNSKRGVGRLPAQFPLLLD